MGIKKKEIKGEVFGTIKGISWTEDHHSWSSVVWHRRYRVNMNRNSVYYVALNGLSIDRIIATTCTCCESRVTLLESRFILPNKLCTPTVKFLID